MRHIKRVVGMTSLLALASIGLMTVSITASYATGNVAYPEWETAQPGEMITLHSDIPCGGDTENQNHGMDGVYARLQQASSSTDFDLGQVARYDLDGSWNEAFLYVPTELGTGVYDIVLTCQAEDEEYNWTTNTVYDAFSISIVNNNVMGMYHDSSEWLRTTTFHSTSTMRCEPLGDVRLSMYQNTTAEAFAYGPFERTAFVSQEVEADGNGDWSASFDLFPDEAPANFDQIDTYVRVECLPTSSTPHVVFDSYMYTPTYDYPEYVALGDSFSSGTGAGAYMTTAASCYRSTSSYPYYLSNNMWMPNLPDPIFAACHGAVTYDILDGSSPQIDSVSKSTYRITLTIGGNDASFADVLGNCANYFPGHNYVPILREDVGFGCGSRQSVIGPVTDALQALAGLRPAENGPYYPPNSSKEVYSIKKVLEELHKKAPYARIYIAGYPKLFGANTSSYTADSGAPGGYACVVNTAPVSVGEARISYQDAQWMNLRTEVLNNIIKNAVDDANLEDYAPGLYYHYVSASTFDGHGLCDSGAPWIRDVDLGSNGALPESFHPNLTGITNGYGVAFINAMDYSRQD